MVEVGLQQMSEDATLRLKRSVTEQWGGALPQTDPAARGMISEWRSESLRLKNLYLVFASLSYSVLTFNTKATAESPCGDS